MIANQVNNIIYDGYNGLYLDHQKLFIDGYLSIVLNLDTGDLSCAIGEQ